MRYVIIVVAITFYILYEQLYNDWNTTDAVVAEVSRLLRMAGL